VPAAATLAVTLLVAATLLFWGGLGVWMSLSLRDLPEWKLSAAAFGLVAALGLAFLVFPGVGAEVMTLFVVAGFLIEGVFSILFALRLSGRASGWGWMAASGAAALVLGLVVLIGWPDTATWLLGLLIGVNFLTTGAALLALRSRSGPRPDDEGTRPDADLPCLREVLSAARPQALGDDPDWCVGGDRGGASGLGRRGLHLRGRSGQARRDYVEALLEEERGELSALDRDVVEALSSHQFVTQNTADEASAPMSMGDRVADRVASFGGSWTFILGFLAVLVIWMSVNAVHVFRQPFDPYPFILLNLVLSTLAALQAPVIMMSQRRQEQKDRLRAENDYRVNLKAELEIRQLHEKIDHQLAHQWEKLAELQKIQIDLLEEGRHDRSRR
jgi:uncharacterized membrane protein/uncharacterized membrane protein HdeD (DUF308 family)